MAWLWGRGAAEPAAEAAPAASPAARSDSLYPTLPSGASDDNDAMARYQPAAAAAVRRRPARAAARAAPAGRSADGGDVDNEETSAAPAPVEAPPGAGRGSRVAGTVLGATTAVLGGTARAATGVVSP